MRFTSPNRITSRGAKRLGVCVAVVAALAGVAGCGGGGSTTGATATDAAPPTTSMDGELLDQVLARQEGAVAAYSEVIAQLSPRYAHMATYFRRQEQEHVDATIRSLRGLDAPATKEPEQIDVGELKTDEERLVFLYELESGTIDEELSANAKLEAPSPRSVLASTVAVQAQHLTLLRQALGAGPLASVPSPFEDGHTPPPEAAAPPAS
jgi:hypothetical protein